MKSYPDLYFNLKSGKNALVFYIIGLFIVLLSLTLPGSAEARPFAAANPAVTLSSSSVMIGEDFPLNVAFPDA